MRTQVFILTATAMMGFAANSLLCRAALRDGWIDAASFTAVRLVTGAIVLAGIIVVRRAPGDATLRATLRAEGSWASMLALAAYAIGFSYAYLAVAAGAGALILFGAVQLTMLVGALVRGERPTSLQWFGWLIAISGLVAINAPGLEPPPVQGALLMASAGIAWGLYSLRGRGITRPLAATAGNFARSVPIALVLLVIALTRGGPLSTQGLVLAAVSGAIASGLGYSLWYAAVPSLGTVRAALVQLAVPVLTTLAALVILDETPRPSVLIGGALIVGGLTLALVRQRSARTTN